MEGGGAWAAPDWAICGLLARAGREMAGSTFSKKTRILPTMLDSTIVFRQLDGFYK